MSYLHDLYFLQGQKYTSFGKNILLRQSTSLGHSATGHPEKKNVLSVCNYLPSFRPICNVNAENTVWFWWSKRKFLWKRLLSPIRFIYSIRPLPFILWWWCVVGGAGAKYPHKYTINPPWPQNHHHQHHHQYTSTSIHVPAKISMETKEEHHGMGYHWKKLFCNTFRI